MIFNSVSAIKWDAGALVLLDQRLLPNEECYIRYHNAVEVALAIRQMVVRGAPAIGISAAYGVVLSVVDHQHETEKSWKQKIEIDLHQLEDSRPTAVNLSWALAKMRSCIAKYSYAEREKLAIKLNNLAVDIHQQDLAANERMGIYGAKYIGSDSSVLTHCNAGALATGGYGTALGVIRKAFELGKIKQVYADETRPWFQGARLTAWELIKDKIPVTLIADSAAAYLMQQNKLNWLIVGADRVAANGDVANKIGTYSAAVNARYHQVKVMVVAPCSTIDLNSESGQSIPIEYREGFELEEYAGCRIAAEQSQFWNPVFDITPASLVDVLVTEKGAIEKPSVDSIERLMNTV